MKLILTSIALFVFSFQYGMNVTLNPNSFDCGTFTVSGNTGCNHNGTLQITVFGNPQGVVLANVSSIIDGNFTFNISISTDAPTSANLVFTIITSDDPTGCALGGATDDVNIMLSCACDLSINLISTDESCFSCDNGTATVTTTGGSSPINIIWSNGSTESTIINLMPGDYSVTLTDANECEVMEDFAIAAYECIPFTVSGVVEDVLCYDDCNGSIQLTSLSNGSTAFTAMWNGGQSTTFLDDLCAATYQVTVTDIDNCITTASFVVTQPDEVTITIDSLLHYNDMSGGTVFFTIFPQMTGLEFYCCDYLGICTIKGQSNITSNSITGVMPNTYNLLVVLPDGCEIFSEYFTIENTSSTHIDPISDIEIYPNPTSDILYLKSLEIEHFIINIFNLSGQIIGSYSNTHSVNVSHLADGMYFVEIAAKGQKKTHKFIKL